LYSAPGQGDYVQDLPAHDTSIQIVRQTRTSSTGADRIRDSETILLVEDEPAILDITTMMLEQLGYQVLTAATPNKALQVATECTGSIDLLITDVIMPGMNGRELAQRMQAIQPQIKCLFMSGYAAEVIAPEGVLEEGVAFIHKPFSMKRLAASVRQALERDASGR
jgi:two-component system cell cycle sensor histidine kinase/response regulator CckA